MLGYGTCQTYIYAVNSSDDKPFGQAEPQESHDNSSDDKDQKPASEKIMERYADVFQGLGCLDGDYHIKIDPAVSPVVHPPRRVPFALKTS